MADCSCGYYCFHQSHLGMARLTTTINRPTPGVAIGGIVKLWGKTEVHSAGMRSEFAVPDVLFVPEGASNAFRDMIEELAHDYRAEVWCGSPDELLKRMKNSKPGLAPALTKFDSDSSLDAVSQTHRLVRVSPAVARRSVELDSRAGGVPLKPHGYWLATSRPSAKISQCTTSEGHRIVKLDAVEDRKRSRFNDPVIEPRTRLILDLTGSFGGGKDSVAVTTLPGRLIGFLPPPVVNQLIERYGSVSNTGVWLLCNWFGTDTGLKRPQVVHVLLAERGAKALTFPWPPQRRRHRLKEPDTEIGLRPGNRPRNPHRDEDPFE